MKKPGASGSRSGSVLIDEIQSHEADNYAYDLVCAEFLMEKQIAYEYKGHRKESALNDRRRAYLPSRLISEYKAYLQTYQHKSEYKRHPVGFAL